MIGDMGENGDVFSWDTVTDVIGAASRGYQASVQSQIEAARRQAELERQRAEALAQARIQAQTVESPYFAPLLIGGVAVGIGLLIFMVTRGKK